MTTNDRPDSDREYAHLFQFASAYLSDAFPNEERLGCPPDSELQSFSQNPRGKNSSITEHLASCSPCFVRYGELLKQSKSESAIHSADSREGSRLWLGTKALRAAVMALCGIIVLGIGLLAVQRMMIKKPVGPSATAYSPFQLDLSNRSPVRGNESTAKVMPAVVPRMPLQINIILPIGSEAGTYNVEFKTKTQLIWSHSAAAHLINGQDAILIDVDLSKLPSGDFDLEVGSRTGVRLSQPVELVEPPSDTGTKGRNNVR